MKAKERHDLHTNALAEWLSVTGEKLRPYSGLITAGSIAVVIWAAIVAYTAACGAPIPPIHRRRWGGQSLAEFPEVTARDYPGTSQAAGGELPAEALDSGSTTLYHNKPAGDAVTTFQGDGSVDDVHRTPTAVTQCAAHVGVDPPSRTAAESLGDLDQAKVAYGQLAKDYPDTLPWPGRDASIWPGAETQPARTKEFYDKLSLPKSAAAQSRTPAGRAGAEAVFRFKRFAIAGAETAPIAAGRACQGPVKSDSVVCGWNTAEARRRNGLKRRKKTCSVDPPIERGCGGGTGSARRLSVRQFPQFSRAFLRRAIDAGGVTLNGPRPWRLRQCDR